MAKDFHVMNVSRGVLFTREKNGLKIESIFPNIDLALDVALEEAQNLSDVVVYVNGDVVYLSEVVDQDNAEPTLNSELIIEEEDSDSVSSDIPLAEDNKLEDEEIDSLNDESAIEADIPDLFKELENLEVGPIVDEGHSVVFGYSRDENGKVELFIQSLDPTPGFIDGIGPTKKKVAVIVDGKKRPPRNVVHDKVTSIVVKSYEFISLNFCVDVENDDAIIKESTLVNITKN